MRDMRFRAAKISRDVSVVNESTITRLSIRHIILIVHGKSGFIEVSKNLDTNLKTILFRLSK